VIQRPTEFVLVTPFIADPRFVVKHSACRRNPSLDWLSQGLVVVKIQPKL
jgi:hypothetical protein